MNPSTTLAGRSGQRTRITLALVAIGAFLVAFAAVAATTLVAPGLKQVEISQSAGAAKRAEVAIEMGTGSLRLSALSEGDGLIAGTVSHPTREELEQWLAVSDGVVRYRLSSRLVSGGWSPGWLRSEEEPRWELGLSRSVPLELRVRSGVGDAQLDLELLRVAVLQVEGGIGATTVTLPRYGEVRASVAGGIGDVVIVIPEGVAARITAPSAREQATLRIAGRPERLPYTSPGYDTAANRVDLMVTSGLGTITVRNVPGQHEHDVPAPFVRR